MQELFNGMTLEERHEQVESYLGKTITIGIDRPIGYVHRKGEKTLVYPINYGYIPDVLGGDGEELDVYLLGVSEPVESYTGRVIGIAYRADDVEDKLIMAPQGVRFSASEMAKAVRFQEKYYHTTVVSIEGESAEVKRGLEVTFPPREQVPDEHVTYAVVAARYEGHWLFCRHKQRATWELPGGHREAGESAEQAARRELYEETGATAASLRLLDVYRAADTGGWGCGALYLADIERMGDIPKDSEMAEVRPFDLPPSLLTYPEIHGARFSRVQYWLNISHSASEMWDVYDVDRRPLGKTHPRGVPLPAGEYHLIVLVMLQNEKGEFLVTRRAPNKGFPNMWEFTGGSALAGDDSLTSALREVREETGIELDPKNGRIVAQEQAWSWCN